MNLNMTFNDRMKNRACLVFNENSYKTAVTVCWCVDDQYSRHFNKKKKTKIICAYACTHTHINDNEQYTLDWVHIKIIGRHRLSSIAKIDRHTQKISLIIAHWWQHRIIENEFMTTHILICVVITSIKKNSSSLGNGTCVYRTEKTREFIKKKKIHFLFLL